MTDTELICGFHVKKFPEKPDYLPLSQDEFQQQTLMAWCGNSFEGNRVAAVFHGGPREWDTLIHDESWQVRAALACHSSERHQLMLASDSEPIVRRKLAVYGTDKVRNTLLDRGETDPEILTEIAKYGSTTLRHRLVKIAWNRPLVLHSIAKYLPASAIDKLLTHPSPEVRIDAAMHGNRAQCMQVLQGEYPSHNITLVFMRDALIDRLKELDKVAQAVNFSKAKSQTYEMERAT